MAKFKIVYEHPVFGVREFEIEVEAYLDSVWEAATKVVEHDGGHLIDVCQVVW